MQENLQSAQISTKDLKRRLSTVFGVDVEEGHEPGESEYACQSPLKETQRLTDQDGLRNPNSLPDLNTSTYRRPLLER